LQRVHILNPTPIFHITDIDNLDRIVGSGGLLSKSRIDQRNISYKNIAYDGLQDRRSTILVPCKLDGVLHDYVPFYFAPRSPMLCAIHNGTVEGYETGQSSVIYLVSDAERVKEAAIGFAFTNGHAIMKFTEFFDDLVNLGKLDWDIMTQNFWGNTAEDGDRKRRRQAEFLIHEFCPWRLIHTIGVKDPATQRTVLEIIKDEVHKPRVKIETGWYY